ncbi:MAG: glycosyltransferase, partial [Vicinamibacterales bacterium]
ADATLVTTPDLKDFQPQAHHLRFFTPSLAARARATKTAGRLKIVHATNHPGIEGTRHIIAAVESLRRKGLDLELIVLTGVTQERVLEELADADLSIGKMKMGYYANTQFESLAVGVPAITYVRPEFQTQEMLDSGLILSTVADLEATIELYARDAAALADKQRKARASVLKLHDNAAIVAELSAIYDRLRGSSPA